MRFRIDSAVVRLSVVIIFVSFLMVESAFSADVPCRFKANSESVDILIVVGEKEHWNGRIKKNETQHVSIPDGPFIVLSKVYNPNLATYEDVRTETHTRVCLERTALSVPLFDER